MHINDFLALPRVAEGLGRAVAGYFWLIDRTTRFVHVPPDALEKAAAVQPAIFITWHGTPLMMLAVPRDLPYDVMISRNGVAGIAAAGAKRYGVDSIRASGSADPRNAPRKGGASGFRQMLKALLDGRSLMITADMPKVSRVASRGAILLARHSGRPIVPITYASKRAIRLNTWDQLTINLPFTRTVVVHGTPMFVPPDADDAAIEAARRALADELDRISAEALTMVGRADLIKPASAQ